MCRCTTTDYHHLQRHRRLKITGFYIRLSLSSSSSSSSTDVLPDSLTLVLPPRTGNAALHVNGSKVPSDSPAFLSLHRILSPDDPNSTVFAARDRLRASDAFPFEIHAAQHRLLNGLFRRHDDTVLSGGPWSMECKCAAVEGINFVREAEVSVALEDGGVMREKVTTRPRRCRRRGFRVGLEDIPEERDEECTESDGACCCCGDVTSSESDGEGEFDYYYDDGDDHQTDAEMEMELKEGVGWAVDVGIWVVCLGVGLLVSRASARKIRRRKLLH